MRVPSFRSIFLGAVFVAGVAAPGCSGDNKPASTGAGSGASSGTGSSSGGSGASGSGGSSAGGGGSGSGSGSAGGGDSSAGSGGGGTDAGACPSGLQDKVTACTGTEPACAKGCGPDTASGALGQKICSCNATTMVYTCAACAYPSLPGCYTPSSASPPGCAAGTANGSPCATACDNAAPGPNPVCTFSTDAGKSKVDGCVCILKAGATSPTWACATQWW
jgi:hypothetical protein